MQHVELHVGYNNKNSTKCKQGTILVIVEYHLYTDNSMENVMLKQNHIGETLLVYVQSELVNQRHNLKW
jgi:hypothetical protein